MCLNGTYPFLSATLVRQLPYYLFRETCFMDSYLGEYFFVCMYNLLGGNGLQPVNRSAIRASCAGEVVNQDPALPGGILELGIPCFRKHLCF